MTHNFNLIVFDWDGTLMDSEARIVACMRAAIADLELAERDSAAIRNIIGLGLSEAICALYPEADADLVGKMFERYRHHYLGGNPTGSELFSGARAVLEELQEAGYFLAVATGKGRVGLDQALAETGLEGFFHYTRCADEAFSKPHPQMLLDVMDFIGAEPARTLMIGDTEYDMLLARNAGTASLGVSYGVHEVERLLQHDPLGIIDSITELGNWLQQHGTRRSA